MRPLIIDDKVREGIKKLIEYAEENAVPFEVIKKAAEGGSITPVGDDPKFSMFIDDGFRVVYSHEHQRNIICKHISVSVGTSGKAPSIEAVQMICDEFGFKNELSDNMVWTENIGEKDIAVNVLEPIGTRWPKIPEGAESN